MNRIHESEAQFHDAWAGSTDLAQVAVREAFEAPTALENRWILARMGPLAGKRILDVGAGLGESSVYFALQGADVTATDISPGMVNAALRLAELHGVKLEGRVLAGESLGEESAYDFVYVANTVHHVADRAALLGQVRRALKPGGRFFSWDPVKYNPAINVYRRMALALFAKYFVVDRVHPNQDRYWKRIFRETDATLGWWKPLAALDGVLTRLPGVRWLAWNVVMTGTKPR